METVGSIRKKFHIEIVDSLGRITQQRFWNLNYIVVCKYNQLQQNILSSQKTPQSSLILSSPYFIPTQVRPNYSRQQAQAVTRLGDLSPIGQLFEVLGDIIFDLSGPNFWQLFGRFFTQGPKPSFYVIKIFLTLKNVKI